MAKAENKHVVGEAAAGGVTNVWNAGENSIVLDWDRSKFSRLLRRLALRERNFSIANNPNPPRTPTEPGA